MTGNVHNLAEVLSAPVPVVVEALTDLLERAKAGEIRGFAFGAACDRHCDSNMFVIGDSDIATIYLAVERVKLRLLQEGE